jgi:hypothetical protein
MQAAVLWAYGRLVLQDALLSLCLSPGEQCAGGCGSLCQCCGQKTGQEVLLRSVGHTGASSLLHQAQLPQFCLSCMPPKKGLIQIHSQGFDGLGCVIIVCFWQTPRGSAAHCSLCCRCCCRLHAPHLHNILTAYACFIHSLARIGRYGILSGRLFGVFPLSRRWLLVVLPLPWLI